MATARKRTEYWRAYGAKRRKSPKYREQQKRRYKAWYERHKATPEYRKRQAAAMAKYRADPDLRIRHHARWITARAIASGKLVRGACEVCGARRAVEAHHDDYYKPLSVRWLCRKHHRELHAKATTESEAAQIQQAHERR